MNALHLRPATAQDIPFIMETERREGYDAFVGRWEADRHAAALQDPRHVYFIGQVGDQPVGFAILRDWDVPERSTLIKRLAVQDPGQGHGRQLLRAVMAAVFEQTNAHRLHLGTFPDNLRARRVYEALGFVAEGIARGSAFFHGTHRDELIMAILRPEWQDPTPPLRTPRPTAATPSA